MVIERPRASVMSGMERARGWGSIVVVFFMVGASVFAQTGSSRGAPKRGVFASDAGMVLNYIKPDKTAEFEAIVEKLKEGLKKSSNPERARQAASWRVFKAAEPVSNGSVLYIFTIDPPVKDADYTVANILKEAFPGEIDVLFKQFAGAYSSGQSVMNLTLVAALGN